MLVLVNVPVADLRKEPVISEKKYWMDPLQESQLVYGEKLMAKEKLNDWLLVEAIEQQKFTEDHGWGGYTGWVLANQVLEVDQFKSATLTVSVNWVEIQRDDSPLLVSMGANLIGLNEKINEWEICLADGQRGLIKKHAVRIADESPLKRADLIRQGIKFLGYPYHWGGRTPYLPSLSTLTSVDCSGLINLIYRVNGKNIPRNAHDQFLKARRKLPSELEPGDLLFMTNVENSKKRINHVMMYVEDELFLESSSLSNRVQLVECKRKLGCSFADLEEGKEFNGKLVWGGSFLDS